jgi:hypothetical protein
MTAAMPTRLDPTAIPATAPTGSGAPMLSVVVVVAVALVVVVEALVVDVVEKDVVEEDGEELVEGGDGDLDVVVVDLVVKMSEMSLVLNGAMLESQTIKLMLSYFWYIQVLQ